MLSIILQKLLTGSYSSAAPLHPGGDMRIILGEKSELHLLRNLKVQQNVSLGSAELNSFNTVGMRRDEVYRDGLFLITH